MTTDVNADLETIDLSPTSQSQVVHPWKSVIEISIGMVAVAFAAVFFAKTIVTLWGFVIDDTYITLSYSRNIARGIGAVYNRGEYVEGYTNPLWTFYLVLPYLIGAPEIDFIKWSNIGLTIISSAAVYSLVRRYCKESPLLAWLAAAAFLIIPSNGISASEGLETTLFTTLLCVSVWAWFTFPERPVGASVAFTLLALTRPDGAMFGLAAIAANFWLKRSPKYMKTFAILFLVSVGCHLAWRWWYYGWPLPNTYYAKGGGTPLLEVRGRQQWQLFRELFNYGIWWIPLYLCLIPVAKQREIVLLMVFIHTRIQFHLWSGGATMGHLRFLLSVLPLLIILGARAMDNVGLVVPKRLAWMRQVVASFAFIGLMYSCTKLDWDYLPTLTAEGLKSEAGANRAHIALGKYLRATMPANSVMMMTDAGAGKYFADLTNVDALGLCDEHTAHLPGNFQRKYDIDYLLGRKPDVVVMMGSTAFPSSVTKWNLKVDADLWKTRVFREQYQFWRSYLYVNDYYLLVFRRQVKEPGS